MPGATDGQRIERGGEDQRVGGERQSSTVDERSAERDGSIWTKVSGLGRCQHSETSTTIDFNKFLMDFRLPFKSISCNDVLVRFNLELNQIISKNYSILSPKLAVQNKQQSLSLQNFIEVFQCLVNTDFPAPKGRTREEQG